MIDYTVTTNQIGMHDDIEKLVYKHRHAIYLRPISERQQAVFDKVNQQVQADGRPVIIDSCCGTAMSTSLLANSFPECQVVGVDKSIHRLSRARVSEISHLILVQADVYDFWRLAVQAKWNVARHFIFYPNPWPKAQHIKRRFHGHPILPTLLQLGSYLEIRSNWELYLQEFSRAAKLLLPDVNVMLSEYDISWNQALSVLPSDSVSLFEKKYRESGQSIFRLILDLNANR